MCLILRRSMPSSRAIGALAAACVVPGSYHLFRRWRASWHTWGIVLHRGCGLVLVTPRKGCPRSMRRGAACAPAGAAREEPGALRRTGTLADGQPSGCPTQGFDAAEARLWPMATYRRAACAVPESRCESGEYRR
jgi:hypothetical protein